MSADATTLPPFISHESATGQATVGWRPFEAASAWVLILLRNPESIEPVGFWDGAYDNDVIRVPVTASAGRADVFAPSGRPVWLALVARDAASGLLPGSRLHIIGQPPSADEGPRLEAPVRHVHAPTGGDRIPFVFAATDAAPPNLERLAQRVATTLGGGAGAARRTAKPPASGFGTKQKWYLTRLRLTPTIDADRRRLAIRSHTFIDAAQLAAWSAMPPSDAIPLPAACDGLIDAVADVDQTVFYAVLEHDPTADDWHQVSVAPLAPPFNGVSAPICWGDPVARLEPVIDARLAQLSPSSGVDALDLTDLPPALDLIRAALGFLAANHPLRTQTEARCEALAKGPKF